MKKLTNIISPIEGFQYSVNIAYDIYDDKKIRSYIPSNSSLQIIEDILASTENKSTDRARLLTGSYGKGKSHLVLYLLAMLAGRDASLFSTAIEKANKDNPNLARNIVAYLSSGKKLLPVIVNATSLDIKSTLLQSLSIALQHENMSDVMPSTFFDAAITKINNWKEKFPKTYESFEKLIGQSGESFVSSLKEYDQNRYDLFVKVYPSLTSGSEFNPLVGSDVIKIYESVIEAIKPLGYSGIFVVYDEFGKFLEGSVNNSSAMDIKLIQDFAEKCNRSGASQLHMLLISHKSIDNYIGRLSKNKVDAWKAVSNRFKSISINNDDAEIYDMVATVLNRDESKFDQFVYQYSNQFNYLKKLIEKEHSFEVIRKENNEELALTCYPLHPYSLLMLPKISELVAQNERTIFTFLSSTEKYSVSYFLRTCNLEFPIIEPDYIYDYFEKLFKGEPYGSNIKKQWQITTSALSKLKEYDNELSEKIVKTLALIYCINDFELLPPSWDIICEIYSIRYSWADIESAKEVLKKAHLLIELLYKPYVRITEGSGHDVLALIQEEIYRIENKIAVKDVLNKQNEIKYFYPVQYNDDNEIIRYFDFNFINVSDLNNIPSDGLKLDSLADGVVYSVLVNTEEELANAVKFVSHNHNKRAIFIVPKSCSDSNSIAINYQAVLNLRELYADKEIELVDELDYILEDRQNLLNSFIGNTYCRFELHKADIYYDGEIQLIHRKAQFSQMLSNIMYNIYEKTPKVVNDLINRNVLSSTIRSARNKILTALLSGSYKKDLGLVGSGPELNIFRSVLVTSGLFINNEEPYIELSCSDAKTREVISEIKNYVLQSYSNSHSLGELYAVLTQPQYGYGLKRGIIPIYLAVIIGQYKEHIIISKKGKELAQTADTLCDIEHNPNDYVVFLEQWDDAKALYIANMEDVFAQYVNSSDKLNGSFVYIVKAMRRWYLQLSKFEIVTKKACQSDGNIVPLPLCAIKFRNTLSSPELNAHEYLFEILPKLFEENDYIKLIKKLREAFEQISNSYKNLHIELASAIKKMFNAKNEISLSSVLADYYDGLKKTTKEHLFSGKISMFLDIAKHPNNDEFKLIELIARALFNLRMSDFTDEIMDCYLDELQSVINDINSYDSQLSNSSSSNGYKIVYNDENGQEVTRQFDATEYTKQGQLLFNDLSSTISEFGEAVTSDEKRQILFKILKELV